RWGMRRSDLPQKLRTLRNYCAPPIQQEVILSAPAASTSSEGSVTDRFGGHALANVDPVPHGRMFDPRQISHFPERALLEIHENADMVRTIPRLRNRQDRVFVRDYGAVRRCCRCALPQATGRVEAGHHAIIGMGANRGV